MKKYSREEFFYTGDWSNGMIGVSKTFGGSSILSSPALKRAGSACKSGISGSFVSSAKAKGITTGVRSDRCFCTRNKLRRPQPYRRLHLLPP